MCSAEPSSHKMKSQKLLRTSIQSSLLLFVIDDKLIGIMVQAPFHYQQSHYYSFYYLIANVKIRYMVSMISIQIINKATDGSHPNYEV